MTSSSTFKGSDGDGYELVMGRWSRRLAAPFLDFSGSADGEEVLDVGCGTGSLTFALAARAKIKCFRHTCEGRSGPLKSQAFSGQIADGFSVYGLQDPSARPSGLALPGAAAHRLRTATIGVSIGRLIMFIGVTDERGE
jgi:hypothetical protein